MESAMDLFNLNDVKYLIVSEEKEAVENLNAIGSLQPDEKPGVASQ
jgi:hypothetical protein